jgi:ABC-type lipoprotein release transport system permease subunit
MSAAAEFAWRSLVRQPARSTLGILGVAAVGALLFDMLLLSEGLVLSMSDLLDRMGFDVRVTAAEPLPGTGPDIVDAPAAAALIAALPTVRAVTMVRSETAALQYRDATAPDAMFIGVGGPTHVWTVLRGRDVQNNREVVLNAHAAKALGAEPGADVTLSASCGRSEAPPRVSFRVAGIVEMPFETPGRAAAATTVAALEEACGARTGAADFLAVTSTGDTAAAVAAITAARPVLGDLS